MIKPVATFFFILFSNLLFAGNPLAIYMNNLENAEDQCWFNTRTDSGNAYSGNHFARTDSVTEYGFGFRCNFPDTCQNKNLRVKFNERLRSNYQGSDFGIVFAISWHDSTVVWKFFNQAARNIKPGEWFQGIDEFTIPRNLTTADHVLSVYLWNNGKKAPVDLDDMEIVFEEYNMPSYWPAEKKFKSRPNKYDRVDLKNVVLWVNEKDGGIFIEDKNQDTIFSSLSLLTETSAKGKKKANWQNKWKQVIDSAAALRGESAFRLDGKISHSVLIVNGGTHGQINFKLNTIFDKASTIARHALMFGYSWKLISVINRSNRVDDHFSNEYWLGKDGLILQHQDTNLIIYHQKDISSLQLNTLNKKFIVNADYAMDHPMIHFPLANVSTGKYIDYSNSVYRTGDTVSCEFTVYLEKSSQEIPLIIPAPNGSRSAFVWTEHADYTDMRTNRAVYLGAEDITDPDSATGGFLKYNIPVTKSIFYTNPQPVDNSIKSGMFPGPELTMKQSDEFRNFIKMLFMRGNEICLHTPDHFTCSLKDLDEALANTRREFGAVTWIDHGYDNAAISNREDLNCDGFDSTSINYSAELWSRYGIQYLWNSFYEDSGMYVPYAYNSFFSTPYEGWSDAMPTPVYWKHKTRTGNFYQWRTTNTIDPADGSLWSYWFDKTRLEDAVQNRSTVIIHSYPARVDSTTGFYDVRNGKVVINGEFDKILQRLDAFRTDGKIAILTLKELLDYRTSLENLTYEFPGNGIVRVKNNGQRPIFGVGFSCRSSQVRSSKKEMKQARVGDELFFWFDIEADETIDLLFKP